MNIKTANKIRTTLKTNKFYIRNGEACFLTDNLMVTLPTDMNDGTYILSQNHFEKLDTSDEIESFKMDLDTSFQEVDVRDIPFDIVHYVSNENDRAPLKGIYMDKEQGCIVATNSLILYSHTLSDIPKSVIIRPEFWKMIHYFKLTHIRIQTNGLISATDNKVTIISKPLQEIYPEQWHTCVPYDISGIEITDEIRKNILRVLKLLKPFYIKKRTCLVTLDGTFIKVLSNNGQAVKVDIGVELFPNRVFCFNAIFLKEILKNGLGYINDPFSNISAVTIRNKNSVVLIMPLNGADYEDEDDLFVELKVKATSYNRYYLE